VWGEALFFGVFLVLCLLGVPLPRPVFWNQYFSWGSSARSLKNKDLEVNSLFFFHLGTFRCRLGPFPTLDPHFFPIKKSILTRARPGEGPFLASGMDVLSTHCWKRDRCRKAFSLRTEWRECLASPVPWHAGMGSLRLRSGQALRLRKTFTS
jgi:hypothetical protein